MEDESLSPPHKKRRDPLPLPFVEGGISAHNIAKAHAPYSHGEIMDGKSHVDTREAYIPRITSISHTGGVESAGSALKDDLDDDLWEFQFERDSPVSSNGSWGNGHLGKRGGIRLPGHERKSESTSGSTSLDLDASEFVSLENDEEKLEELDLDGGLLPSDTELGQRVSEASKQSEIRASMQEAVDHFRAEVLTYKPPIKQRVDLKTAPIFSAVFDSRMSDLMARLLSYTWSKPFNSFNDNQLFTFALFAFTLFMFQMLRSRRFRRKTWVNLRVYWFRLVLFLGMACFLELCLREAYKNDSQSSGTWISRTVKWCKNKMFGNDEYKKIVKEFVATKKERDFHKHLRRYGGKREMSSKEDSSSRGSGSVSPKEAGSVGLE